MIIFVLTLVYLFLAVLALTGVDRGTASYYILLVDFGLIALLLAVIAIVFWRCGYLSEYQPEY